MPGSGAAASCRSAQSADAGRRASAQVAAAGLDAYGATYGALGSGSQVLPRRTQPRPGRMTTRRFRRNISPVPEIIEWPY
jgi:hypothetical protein